MNKTSMTRLSLAIGLAITTGSALAAPQQFLSARSFAMGGTGVAVAHPVEGNTANPAMLAADQHDWANDFGLMLPSLNARAADDEDVVDQIDDIQDTIDLLEQSANAADVAATQQAAGILRNQLIELNRDTMRVDLGLGVGMAVPGSSLAVGVFTNANARITARGNISDSDLETLRLIEEGNVTGAETIGDNLTSDGTVLASAVAELGISFARSFNLGNDRSLQLGITPKYVEMRTYELVEQVGNFDEDSADDEQNETEDSGLTFDMGAAYAFGDERQWNAGLVVRNIVPLDLDSVSGRTLELDPLVTAGIAHKGDFHALTAEVDLTKKKAFGFEDDTQWLAVGAELDAWRYAQLRFGARHNLASNDDNAGVEESTQLTAGLGLSPFGARLDIGALLSDQEVGAAIELGVAF